MTTESKIAAKVNIIRNACIFYNVLANFLFADDTVFITVGKSTDSVDTDVGKECGPTRNEVNTPNIDIRLSGYDIEMCPNTEVSMCICRAIEDAIRW